MKRFVSKAVAFVLLAALALSIASCGASNENSLASKSGGPMSAGPRLKGLAQAAPTVTTASADGYYKEMPAPGGGLAYPTAGIVAASGPASGYPDIAEPPVAAGGETLHYGSSGQSAPNYQSSLTAGQIDDNARFDEYLDYLRSSGQLNALPIDVRQRLFVRVVDGAQHPVAGARVQLFDGDRQLFDGRTMSDGRVLFFPNAAGESQAQQYRAVISRGTQKIEATLRAGVLEQTVTLGVPDNTGPVKLDIVFMVDSTGSMGDEIDALKSTIDSIAYRIEQLPGSSAPRLALVSYRDRGDEYVTRDWDFVSDVERFSGNLSQIDAGGGGDEPESVNQALHDAIHLQGWSDAGMGRQLKMIILVGDAPPHLDYPGDYEYPSLLQEAVASGIKIFPIGASGLNDQGEYIFRQFAQVTQGQFVFLTYANGVSGAPGPATTHHVSDFSVKNLDSLVVSLVAGEVANQTGDKSQAGTVGMPVQASVVTPGRDDLLSMVPGWVRSTVDQLVNLSTLFWLVLLGLILFSARRVAARSKREEAPPPVSLVLELDRPDDLLEEAPSRGARVVMEDDIRVPEAQLVWATSRVEQPTLPLGSLPSRYRASAQHHEC